MLFRSHFPHLQVANLNVGNFTSFLHNHYNQDKPLVAEINVGDLKNLKVLSFLLVKTFVCTIHVWTAMLAVTDHCTVRSSHRGRRAPVALRI